MENLSGYTKTELLKISGDIKLRHDKLKKEIIADTYEMEELEKRINSKVAEMQELERNYVEIVEKLMG